MSTTLVSQYSQLYDLDVNSVQNRLNKMNTEHLAVGAPVSNFSRNRNMQIGTFGTGSAFVPVTSTSNYSSIIPSNTMNMISSDNQLTNREHRKLDRSWSEPCEKVATRNTTTTATVNSTRYKTELCRPFEENGHCKYGDKCQFAHGKHELQNLARHPKYKTDLCRTFHTIGFCPYGPRCHFIHSEEERKINQQKQTAHPGVIQPPQQPIQRPNSIKYISMSSLDSPSSSVNTSPTTHSPNFFGSGDDIFSSANIGTFSPNQQSNSSNSSRSSPVFNSAPELELMTPLNVQTHMNNANHIDMSAFQNQFNSSLNLNTQRIYDNINQNGFDDGFLSQVFRESQTYNDVAPSSSPVESVSGMSVGSFASNSSTSSGYGSSSPTVDLSRNMRLPIFNRLSQEL